MIKIIQLEKNSIKVSFGFKFNFKIIQSGRERHTQTHSHVQLTARLLIKSVISHSFNKGIVVLWSNVSNVLMLLIINTIPPFCSAC